MRSASLYHCSVFISSCMGWAVDPSKPKLCRYVLLFNYRFIKKYVLYLGVRGSRMSSRWAVFFPCFFLSCKANARVNPKTGHGPHSSNFLCCSMYFLCCSIYFLCCSPNFCVVLYSFYVVSFSVSFVCICVLSYYHRVATQLLLNISYNISNLIPQSETCFLALALRILRWLLYFLEKCRTFVLTNLWAIFT
jgi:hypothetical protein